MTRARESGAVATQPPTFISQVRGYLSRLQPEIAKALPKHLTPDRMIRVALTTLQKTPELQNCDPLSVVGGIVQASQLGLEIDGVLGQAYLVPFKRSCNLIIGYKGYLALAHRAGCQMTPRIVHANDGFGVEYGTDQHIRHTPSLADPGDPIAVYCVATFERGEKDFEVIRWPEIVAFQQKYGKGPKSPWFEYLGEMAKKTAIRRGAKRWPVSVEFRRAADLEHAHEEGRSQGLEALTGPSRTDEALARLSPPDEMEGASPDASPTEAREPGSEG